MLDNRWQCMACGEVYRDSDAVENEEDCPYCNKEEEGIMLCDVDGCPNDTFNGLCDEHRRES